MNDAPWIVHFCTMLVSIWFVASILNLLICISIESKIDRLQRNLNGLNSTLASIQDQIGIINKPIQEDEDIPTLEECFIKLDKLTKEIKERITNNVC